MSKILSTGLDYARKAGLAALPRDAVRRDKVAMTWQIIAMPTIWSEQGFYFFFSSEEGNEPPHVHIRKGSGRTGPRGKVWLAKVEMVAIKGLTSREVSQILRIVERKKDDFNAAWSTYFGETRSGHGFNVPR